MSLLEAAVISLTSLAAVRLGPRVTRALFPYRLIFTKFRTHRRFFSGRSFLHGKRSNACLPSAFLGQQASPSHFLFPDWVLAVPINHNHLTPQNGCGIDRVSSQVSCILKLRSGHVPADLIYGKDVRMAHVGLYQGNVDNHFWVIGKTIFFTTHADPHRKTSSSSKWFKSTVYF